MPQNATPAPRIDEESAFFWEGLRARRLLLQRCSTCGEVRFPAMPACPACAAIGSEVIEAGGGGRLYSWVTVHHAFDEAWKHDVPYTVGVVELDEGARVLARIEPPQPLRADAALLAFYVDHGTWSELRFRPEQAG